jgi:beta-lactamase superfamily II metal-dependent hydrolase
MAPTGMKLAGCFQKLPGLEIVPSFRYNYSIIILVIYGESSFLFTEDAQVDSEKEMLAISLTSKLLFLK